MVDAKTAVQMIEDAEALVKRLRAEPEMQGIVLSLLQTAVSKSNGRFTTVVTSSPKKRTKRHLSAAQRKQMSILAKKRWKAAKKDGKTSLG